MERWIKLFDKIKEWQHYQEPTVMLVWIDILLSANAKDGWSRGKKIKRGELITSVATIMYSTGIGSDNTVREALRKLEESGEIKRERLGNATKITINQFSKYQGYSNSAEHTAERTAQPVAEHTAERTADKQEYIEGKNIDNINNISSSSSLPNNLPNEKEEDNDSSGCDAPQTEEYVNYEKLVEFFNKTTSGVFGKIRYPLGNKRTKSIKARIREFGKQSLVEVIEKAAASDFLKGQNERGFVATFDWMITPSNFEKILSGNYDNRETRNKSRESYSGDKWIGTEFIEKI